MAVAIYSSTPLMPAVHARHLQQIALPVADVSQVSEARRAVAERTAALQFSSRTAGEAAIVATEMAGNLVKHGGGGELLLRTIGEPANAGIELLALDRGRGMDVSRCLVDGYSTAASPGTGLGAIRRLSASSDFYGLADRGSAVLATIWRNTAPADAGKWVVGGINVPLQGEEICGDAWVVRCHDAGLDAMVVDGLGHGPEAAKAAAAAATAFLARTGRSPSESLDAADAALQSTRGAAMGVAVIDLHGGKVSFAGIGNTVAIVVTRDVAQHLVSFGGIVGKRNIHLREFTSPWSGDSMFVGHSDGIGTRWSLTSYPGLSACHPSLIAGVLYRDFARGRDDASVLVIKPWP
ncbi:MAG TPA: SpoIIE family protein phosphatase [Thermoanaerobaculia bacterium]